MRCDETRLALYAMEDGELDRGGGRDVVVHLERCEACRRRLADDRRVKALVRWQASTMPAAPQDLWSRVAARVEADDAVGSRPGARSRSRRRWSRVTGVATAAAIILALVSATNLSPPADIETALASELVADHERSLRRAAGPADVPGGDPAVILARLDPGSRDFVRAPRMGTVTAALLGGSVCRLGATRGIRWSYRIDGAGLVSLYQLVHPRSASSLLPHAGRQILTASGGTRSFVLWADQGVLHALVGAVTEAELRRLAARIGYR